MSGIGLGTIKKFKQQSVSPDCCFLEIYFERFFNGFSHYGYCFENGCIAVQSQEQAIVREIYNGYLSGKSLLNIAAELNTQSVEFISGIIG